MVVEVAGGVVCPSRRVRRWYVSRSVRHFATFGVVLTLLVGLQLRFFKKSNPREYTGGRPGKTRREDGEFAVQALRDADLKCKVRYPLHVSVMTSRNRLPTFASAAHSTWARQNEQASVEFFLPKSAEQTTIGKQRRRHGLGLPAAVVLSDESTLVDVPILRYLCKWREDDFDWFLVTDDQAYVRLDSVIDFLRQVDKTEAVLLSRQGEAFVSELTWERCGTGDADDVPLTSLMAASVTVYSGPAVRGICSAVEGCLYDLNDGPLYLTQCLSSYTVTMCQDQREQYSHLFYEDAPPTSGPTNNVTSGPTLPPGFVDALKNRDVTKALTLSPMRSPDDIYRLHQHFQRIDF
ncbi:chondroitin sulfate synthase 3-like [Branchiostoma floridae x Branchiostoma belcheri]